MNLTHWPVTDMLSKHFDGKDFYYADLSLNLRR